MSWYLFVALYTRPTLVWPYNKAYFFPKKLHFLHNFFTSTLREYQIITSPEELSRDDDLGMRKIMQKYTSFVEPLPAVSLQFDVTLKKFRNTVLNKAILIPSFSTLFHSSRETIEINFPPAAKRWCNKDDCRRIQMYITVAVGHCVPLLVFIHFLLDFTKRALRRRAQCAVSTEFAWQKRNGQKCRCQKSNSPFISSLSNSKRFFSDQPSKCGF